MLSRIINIRLGGVSLDLRQVCDSNYGRMTNFGRGNYRCLKVFDYFSGFASAQPL